MLLSKTMQHSRATSGTEPTPKESVGAANRMRSWRIFRLILQLQSKATATATATAHEHDFLADFFA